MLCIDRKLYILDVYVALTHTFWHLHERECAVNHLTKVPYCVPKNNPHPTYKAVDKFSWRALQRAWPNYKRVWMDQCSSFFHWQQDKLTGDSKVFHKWAEDLHGNNAVGPWPTWEGHLVMWQTVTVSLDSFQPHSLSVQDAWLKFSKNRSIGTSCKGTL